jgi:hypothetical protein
MNLTNWIFPFTGNLFYDAAINLFIFLAGFVAYALLQPAIKAKQWWKVLPWSLLILHAAIIDVLFNQGPGRLMFMELINTWTLSDRLDLHYLEEGWRGDRSRWWADRLVNRILKGHITGKKAG